MTLKEELTTYIGNTFGSAWTITDGRQVPSPESAIGLGNDAVKISATILYADLADSTGLVKNHEKSFATEIYKSYVYAAAKLIRDSGGSVTSYDGDRVMGVFMGASNWSTASRVALKIQGAVVDIVRPAMKKAWPDKTFKIAQKCGVAYSEIWVANTGIRGNNDYVWVGRGANDAAKMAALDLGYTTYISGAIFDVLSDSLKKNSAGGPVWHDLGSGALGYKIWGSNAHVSL